MRRKTNGRQHKKSWRKKQYDLLMNLIRKEKDGGYLSFIISIPLGAQDQLPNLQEPVKNKSVGHKTNVGSLVQETVVILRQGEQRWGPF